MKMISSFCRLPLLSKWNANYMFFFIGLTGLLILETSFYRNQKYCLPTGFIPQIKNSSIQDGNGKSLFVHKTSPSGNSSWRSKNLQRPGNLVQRRYSDWRSKELQRLGNIVQRRLFYLQNPKDCENARKILCTLGGKVGFGSQMNDWVLCLIVAYATQRTLIIESKGWVYAEQGMETVFVPLSTNCTSTKNQTVIQLKDLRNIRNIKEVVKLPRNVALVNRPDYLPMSIPEDLAEQISRVHENPSIWWIGQFLTYLTRQNLQVKRFTEQTIRKLGSRHPVVGIHVRRTDKKKEAKYQNLSEYMDYVKTWFDSYERRHGAVQRRVYIASDEPTIINEAKKSYPNFIFMNNINSSTLANILSTRYSEASLHGIIIDTLMLSMCDFVVCTMSSSFARVVYELMHVRYWDAPRRIRSLDTEFAFHLIRKGRPFLANNANSSILKKVSVVKDISNYHKLTLTADNKRNRVKMPTYPEVQRFV